MKPCQRFNPSQCINARHSVSAISDSLWQV
ncbi:positive regulator for repZ translation [Escherichia coli]|uniref:Positive regulator for repZ translation n=5 Tax=Escherichia coli TaxID=562 RepID=F2W491_ECOLX|nr:RepY protein [Escherichia coli O26:H-]ADZ45197.1 RepY protein [Escherichia coli]AUF79777.1 positive regulator for repZ translation [Escherichia coli O121:H19]AWJ30380.1 positive regulator for repZ translation [Escherichia coli O121 str. RM8352]AWJ36097.1 positive regulator for repZ translation [Escherichia coli O103 str. RM8385]AWJ36166.1 positive regulator for repZ translation [Escherichia coli O26 str. RM8426]AWJ52171.1 positive regulator for repZ translation [Escherichia coli O26 str. R